MKTSFIFLGEKNEWKFSDEDDIFLGEKIERSLHISLHGINILKYIIQ
jgi:hypothetical protein